MNKTICIILFPFIILLFFEVHEYLRPLPAREWIATNLDKIHIKDPAHFSFAVFGGNRGSRTVFESLLKQVDHDSDIAFAVDLGNTVLKGEKANYQYFINQIKNNLGIPLLTAIGNNELNGDGRGLYYEIFGPFYYSFKIGWNYFIVLDDVGINGLDHQQMKWLEKELEISKDYDNRIIFLHLPLYDPSENRKHQCLPEKISQNLIELFLKYRVTHIFSSQINGYFEGDWKGIPYTITGGAGTVLDRLDKEHGFFHFLKVCVEKDIIAVEIKEVSSSGHDQMNAFKYAVLVYADNLIRIHWAELLLIFIILLSYLVFVMQNRISSNRIK